LRDGSISVGTRGGTLLVPTECEQGTRSCRVPQTREESIMNIPAAVKAVGQYVKRAEEIEKDATNPDGSVIAFWCRQWATERSIPYYSEEGVSAFIGELMDTQERNKAAAGDKSLGKSICENHAHLVFGRADADDRAGKGNKMTAKLFYNAASFLDILEQFEELKEDSDILNMRKYSKWKANDILQALKEGRTPQVGGPDEPPSSSGVSAHISPTLMNLPPPATSPYGYATSAPPVHSAPPAYISQPPVTPTNMNTNSSTGIIGNVIQSVKQVFTTQTPVASHRAPPKAATDPRVKDSIELSHFAIASMKYGDISGAKAKLAEALRRLE